MKAISKVVATVIVGTALLGSGAGVAVAVSVAPAAHSVPLAATAVEYAL